MVEYEHRCIILGNETLLSQMLPNHLVLDLFFMRKNDLVWLSERKLKKQFGH
jgi:hypothetical protein